MEVISSICYYVPGKLQGLNTDFLIDSGSTYTVVNVDLYKMIPKSQRPELKKCNLILCSANGEMLQIHGKLH